MKRASLFVLILLFSFSAILLEKPLSTSADEVDQSAFDAVASLRKESGAKGEEATASLASLDYLGHSEAFDRAVFALTEAVLGIIEEYDYPIRRQAAEDLGNLLVSQDERLILLNSQTVWKGISTLLQVQLALPKWRGGLDRNWEHLQLRKSCTNALLRIARKFAASPVLRELYDRMTASVERE
ncbi:MAG: hypothetical protein HY391_00690 [Deltaproteobacteria bacterium]|nr:hypothetical protein [Deltaproteobacteria bacterium]